MWIKDRIDDFIDDHEYISCFIAGMIVVSWVVAFVAYLAIADTGKCMAIDSVFMFLWTAYVLLGVLVIAILIITAIGWLVLEMIRG